MALECELDQNDYLLLAGFRTQVDTETQPDSKGSFLAGPYELRSANQ